MKPFLNFFLLVYFAPIFCFFVLIFIVDPLKCFRSYPEYYKNSFVTPNRENVCLKLFERNDSTAYFNSFILGNSCSHAFKSYDWRKYLPQASKIFHLDAYRENVFGILKKLEFLEKRKNKIDNVLIVIDRSVFSSRLKSYMYAMPPELEFDSSDFYLEHFKALTSIKFIGSYFFYSLAHYNLSFMEDYHFSNSQPVSNNFTGDLTYLADKDIARDPQKYFSALKKQQWLAHDKVMAITSFESYIGLDSSNKTYLKKIRSVFIRNNTKFKIIINPLYDQKQISRNDLSVLEDIFGYENLFDFSGINPITEDYRNFYDGIHYRPKVAEEIMNVVYGNGTRN